MRNTVKNLIRASLALAIVVAAGCQDGTGPGSLERLDTEAVLADYQAMDAVLQSTGWKSFQMTAASMDAATLGAAPAAAMQAGAALDGLAAGDSREFARAMTGVASASTGTASGPLISDANRGKTFVYDAVSHSWVIDPSRTDAPANGVRFIIYEPAGAEPDPTKPIGHADLIDLGDASAGIALRLVVVEDDLTVLDYHTTLDGADGSGRITVTGFVQNTRDRLDFEIDVRGQNVGGVERGDITFELAIADREFRVLGDIHGEKQNGSEQGSVDLTVRHGASSFRVDVENDGGQLSGFIDLNDAPFATVSGAEHQPVFRTPSGDDINGAQALVLWRVFDITEDVFDLFEDLVEPIAGLVIIAIIL
ncbi:MAG TPA: hypothetical protein VFZ24_10540 [Longimicrobiales bacterium]